MTSTAPEASEPIVGFNGLYTSFDLIDESTGQPAGTPQDFSRDIKAFNVEPEAPNSDDLTFTEAKNGGAGQDPVTIVAIQSTQVGSFWRFLYDNVGRQVRVIVGLNGNAVPSADKPHQPYTLKITQRPPSGGQATLEPGRFEFSIQLTQAAPPGDLITAAV